MRLVCDMEYSMQAKVQGHCIENYSKINSGASQPAVRRLIFRCVSSVNDVDSSYHPPSQYCQHTPAHINLATQHDCVMCHYLIQWSSNEWASILILILSNETYLSWASQASSDLLCSLPQLCGWLWCDCNREMIHVQHWSLSRACCWVNVTIHEENDPGNHVSHDNIQAEVAIKHLK